VFEGHGDEVFACGFTYEGGMIFTAGKDNVVRLWS
jgi:WD40 repeat protein